MRKHITLMQAHKIKSLSAKGLSIRKIAKATNTDKMSVQRVLAGKYQLQQQQIADNMEAFLGGVIIGEGNTRAFAEDNSYEGDSDVHSTRAQHPIGETWENGQRVLPAPDVLSILLAEEELIHRLSDAGLDPEYIMVVDHESDVEDGAQMGGEREHRDPAIHDETWEEFVTRAERDSTGNVQALIAHRLETEGADVDVWSVRDPDFRGWPSMPWSPDTTNDIVFTKRTRA